MRQRFNDNLESFSEPSAEQTFHAPTSASKIATTNILGNNVAENSAVCTTRMMTVSPIFSVRLATEAALGSIRRHKEIKWMISQLGPKPSQKKELMWLEFEDYLDRSDYESAV